VLKQFWHHIKMAFKSLKPGWFRPMFRAALIGEQID